MVENMTTDRGMLAIKLAESERKENASSTMKTFDNTSPSENGNGDITSRDNLSFWFASAIKPIAFEKLSGDVDTDILVVGGGISGLTTAYCFAKEGLNVILVDEILTKIGTTIINIEAAELVA